MSDIPDNELLKLIIEADDLLLREGMEPRGRSLTVIQNVMGSLGQVFSISPMHFANPPPLAQRIRALHTSLYRSSDFGVGGLHGGVFMFRDVFARITVPIIYGRVRLNPFEMTDLSEKQIQWMCSRDHDMHMFLDQFVDIYDFAGGTSSLGGYKTPPKEALDTFMLAAFQFQAAAAALSVAFDFRGAVQSAIIGAELALKGGLATAGADEAARRKHGHNLASAARAIKEAMSNFDLERVLVTILCIPPYVENRYSPTQPNRIETGHIVMGAQYIAGEVMRQVTGHSIRRGLSMPAERVYPPLSMS